MPERYEELDSLRGLAAMTVFCYHCIFLLAICPAWLAWTIRTPLGLLLYGGHQAVILFFVLSGFVLHLPYTRQGYRASYPSFIVKRICRIYLPYLGALLFFVLAYVLFFNANRPAGLSELYGWRPLSLGQGLTLFRDHVLFVGFYHRDYWNGATWTLAEEMRISFIFVLLAMMVVRLRTRTSLLLALGCSAMVSLAIRVVHHRTPFEPFHYASLFVLGAVLAANRLALLGRWSRIGRPLQSALVAVAVLTSSYALVLMEKFPRIVTEEASDWLIALSVSVFLLAALAGTWFTRVLRQRFMLHLGKTSYGIYLLHLPVIFVFVSLLWTRVPPLVVFALSLPVTLVLAHVFHVYLEQPSMALGKRLARLLDRRSGVGSTTVLPGDGPLEAAGSMPLIGYRGNV